MEKNPDLSEVQSVSMWLSLKNNLTRDNNFVLIRLGVKTRIK